MMHFEARRTLSEFLGPDLARHTSLEPIKGGQSAATLYRFSCDGQVYVLRLLGMGRPDDRRRHEVTLTLAASQVGAGPAVHFVASDNSAIIYEYTPGRTLSLDDVRDERVLELLAERLSRLHRATVDVPVAASPFECFYGFRRRILEAGRPWPEAMIEATAYVRRVEREISPTLDRPSHLDLHARNIILTPAREPVFIDWGNGGLSDPAFDLATIIAFLGLDRGQRSHLLEVYQEAIGETLDRSRIELLAPIRPLVVAVSCLVTMPPDVSLAQVEHEIAQEHEPYPDLFCRPRADRPVWPVWRWGVAALKMGLFHIRSDLHV